jgi:DnaJ family protein C protein 3
MKHHRYLIACVLPFLFSYSVFADKSAQQYLSEGSSYLTSGKLNDALISFDAAIRKFDLYMFVVDTNLSIKGMEPDNYLSYFKRATTYLTLGRNNAAAEDFTKILSLKPEFDKALLQRARIYVKDGNFELAIRDLENYLMNKPHDSEAEQLVKYTNFFSSI